MIKNDKTEDDLIWKNFAKEQQLTDFQLNQFKIFNQTLIQTNEIHNLTTITNLKSVINNHFIDSLVLGEAINLNKVNSIADIGTGGGFPGIPLKIKYPHLKIVLIEVIKKKIDYLNILIEKLELKNIEIYDLDWRTFLRKTNFAIDIFCARASLKTEQLLKVFQPASPYKNSTLVYWASHDYQLTSKEMTYFYNEYFYKIGIRRRRLILFSQKNN